MTWRDLRSNRRGSGPSRPYAARVTALALAAALAIPPAGSVAGPPAAENAPAPASAAVETAFGLHTATFPTPHGVVRANLSDDLTAGDTISGTVFEEPAGSSETERAQNEDE